MALDGSLIGLVLLAALLHASWNAVAKASSDPLLGMAVVTASGGLLAGAALPLLPRPEAASWPYLGASVALHFLYQVSLVRAYRLGDLSQVYPIARGLAPLGVALLAAATAREVPAPAQAVGLLLVSGAVLSLASVGRSAVGGSSAALPAALTAVLISAYTVVDALGVRSCSQPFGYIAWMFFLDSFPILLLALALRRRRAASFLRAEGARAGMGGAMAALSYGLVLWALASGAMAPIAALRETSVVFAAVIGTRLLGEPFGAHRLAATGAMAFGLVLVQS